MPDAMASRFHAIAAYALARSIGGNVALRWGLSWAFLLVMACGQEHSSRESDEPPPPVRPVEVTPPAPTTPTAEQQELEQLRTRVAQLETDLATCRNTGTQVAPIPTGADPPPSTATTAAPVASNTPATTADHPARTQPRDPAGGLLPTTRRDGTIVLPNPANILLGNGRGQQQPQQ
jgi:hypothetical protein